MAKPNSTTLNAQLAAYRCLLDNARAMLKAAREARWEDLPELDVARNTCMTRVREADLVSTRPADIAAQTELIQSILDCDEQTRHLLHAWREALSAMPGIPGDQREPADACHNG